MKAPSLAIFAMILVLSSCSSDRIPASVMGGSAGISDGEIVVGLGSHNSCALVNGFFKCWGFNDDGQFGNGNTDNQDSPSAVEPEADKSIKKFALGLRHSCAIFDDDSLKCWGSNARGRLGSESPDNSLTPVNVSLPAGRFAKTVALGTHHSCAILVDDSLVCWGKNSSSQLGNGEVKQRQDAPVAVGLGEGERVKSMALGEEHSCAVLKDGSLWCWGSNAFGQLGDGSTNDSHSPVRVDLGDDEMVKAVKTIFRHTSALLYGGTLKCWGLDDYGQLGIDSGSNDTCTVAGSDYACKKNPTAVDFGAAKVQIFSLAYSSTCALTGNYSLTCWGRNDYGQLGDGSSSGSNTPSRVALEPGTKIKDIVSGYHHTCVLAVDNSLWCWGYNFFGQLGDGSTTKRTSPVTIDLGV